MFRKVHKGSKPASHFHIIDCLEKTVHSVVPLEIETRRSGNNSKDAHLNKNATCRLYGVIKYFSDWLLGDTTIKSRLLNSSARSAILNGVREEHHVR